MTPNETIATEAADFRDRVKADWAGDETAAAWQTRFPAMREQMAEVTAALVLAADPRPGMDVLDLAAGTGDPSLTLARKVLPGGTVTSTDFSPHMIEALRHNAADEGLENVRASVCDAQDLPFPESSFDRVVSRFGGMFWEDVPAALAGVRRVLKPEGRVALLAWGEAGPGTYFGAAVLPFMKRLEKRPDPDGPAPMRFAEPGKLARLVRDAGFMNVQEKVDSVLAPYKGTPDELMDDLLALAAPFRQLVEGLPDPQREEAMNEALTELKRLTSDGVIRLHAPIVVVTGDVPRK